MGETAQEEIIMPADILGFGYALTVAAGGLIGYLKAGNFSSELLAVLQCFFVCFCCSMWNGYHRCL